MEQDLREPKNYLNYKIDDNQDSNYGPQNHVVSKPSANLPSREDYRYFELQQPSVYRPFLMKPDNNGLNLA